MKRFAHEYATDSPTSPGGQISASPLGCHIRVLELSKHYVTSSGRIQAVSGLSLDIPASSVYAVIGPSGAGKSTLFRCLGALEQPDAGSILLDGVDLVPRRGAALREARHQIGLTFQQYALLNGRTALDNVALPLELRGSPSPQRRARARELLSWVGLEGREESYPSMLSGGQRQRVAIARALASSPRLLLCDEPTSALDPGTTDVILALLRKIRDVFGTTIVIITHEMRVVRDVCDRVAVLESGRVVEEGRVDDLLVSARSVSAQRLAAGSRA